MTKQKAFVVPACIEFEKGGKTALQRAIRSIRSRSKERPIIAIVGPARSGKTTLVEALLNYFYGHAAIRAFPQGEREMQTILDAVVLNQQPYVCFDAGRVRDSRELHVFTRVTRRPIRIIYTQKVLNPPILSRVFLTATGDLPEVLARRAIVIRLKGAQP